jgi:hypothetical protein
MATLYSDAFAHSAVLLQSKMASMHITALIFLHQCVGLGNLLNYFSFQFLHPVIITEGYNSTYALGLLMDQMSVNY